MAKYAIELSQFDIQFKLRTTIKGQAFIDFVAKFTYKTIKLEPMKSDSNPIPSTLSNAWKIFVDGSTNWEGSEIGIALEIPTHEKILRAFKLDFPISNNEIEYETLLTGLRIAMNLDVKIHLGIL